MAALKIFVQYYTQISVGMNWLSFLPQMMFFFVLGMVGNFKNCIPYINCDILGFI